MMRIAACVGVGVGVVGVLGACSSPSQNQGCVGAKCDDLGVVDELRCDVLNLSGDGSQGVGRGVDSLRDPVALTALRGQSCADDVEQLKERISSGANCSISPARHVDALDHINDSSADGILRSVISAGCSVGDAESEVWISQFGLSEPFETLPDDAELMAFDPRLEAFNFYKLHSGQWSYFGSSQDLLAGPGQGEERACARCHISGGPVMKELRDPWVNWALSGPGSRPLMFLESEIRAQTDLWTPSRADHAIATQSIRQVLRPVFCTEEFQIGSRRISEFLLANTVYEDLSISDLGRTIGHVDQAAYEAAILGANQRLETRSGPVTDGNGQLVRDATESLVHIERSDADVSYILHLIDRGFVSQRLVDDVRMIDFTRAVFSDERCGLLEHVPDRPAIDATPESITSDVIASLEAVASPSHEETELLAALTDESPDHAEQQLEREQAFLDTCAAQPDLTEVAVEVASQLRDLVRDHPVIEFPQQLPVDDLNIDPSLRLDEADCHLK